MHILFLTPQLPYPPQQGTTMRNHGLIRGLAERHQISLLSFRESSPLDEEPGPTSRIPEPLLALCRRVETVPAPHPRPLMRRALDTLTHPLPDMALRLASTALAERLAAWLAQESFDVIQIEGIEMTPYLDLLLEKGRTDQVVTVPRSRARLRKGNGAKDGSPLVIFDDHNCEYMLQKSYAQIDALLPRRWPGALYSLIQWQKLRRYEASVCRRAHRVLAVSQTDAQALRQLAPDLDVAVIPNGIDTDQYQPGPIDAAGDPDQPPTVVFVGKMDFRPNVDAVRWFVEEIWPQVRAEVPEAHFYAVGQRPHPRLDPLHADASVTLTGWVEDVRPYIAQAAVYVLPLRMGSGTRLKLLEGMALGKAIVSTRMGAEGFTAPSEQGQRGALTYGRVTHDRELVLVRDNDPAAFARAIIALLRDPARRAGLGANARAFARAHYDWRVIIPRLEALYAQARQTAAPGARAGSSVKHIL
jgi:glycosyltransferase involved in cell wall biosynthesis